MGLGILALAGAKAVGRSAVPLLPLILLVTLIVTATGGMARADCVQNGLDVTCAPPGDGGFAAGVGIDGLTVTVEPAATAHSDTFLGATIGVNDNNTVVNNGTITGTAGVAGIQAGFNNSITNNGTISTGIGGAGIVIVDGNTVTNNGSIAVAETGIGIVVDSQNTVVNYGSITTGMFGIGVQFGADQNTFTNYGTVRALGGTSVEACPCLGTDNVVNNYGTLDGTLDLFAADNVVNNYGLITITNDDATPVGTAFHLVTGTFNQSPSGILELRVTPDGFNDFLVAERLNLAGTLRAAVRPGLYPDTTIYDVVGVSVPATTTFDRFVATSPFFSVTPIYDSGDPTAYTDLSIQLTRIPFGEVPGLTPNQQAVGNALERGYSTSLTGDAATFYTNILTTTSTDVLDQLSGQGTSAAQGASFMTGGLFNQTMMQQVWLWLNGGGGNAIGGALPYAATEARKPGHDAFAAMQPKPAEAGRWHAWASGFGADREVYGDAAQDLAGQTQRTAGGAVGVSHQVHPDLLVGVAVGGSGSTFSVSSLSTSGRVNAGHFGIYAVKTMGPAYLAAAVNYARLDNSTERTISGAGPTENATGDFAADQVSARIELGRVYRFGGINVTPFVAVEPAALWQHAYTETSTVAGGGGAGVLGLSYDANTVTSLPAFLGAQIDARYVLPGGQMLSPRLRAAWVHEFSTERPIQASFVSVPGTGFTVDGARAGSDALRLGAGATLAFNTKAYLFANLEGEFSDAGRTYAATGGIRLTW
jgi:uncharacterized protein with beta-barrel porin domain